MSRLAPAAPELYVPLFGEDAPLRQQVYANAPHIAGPFREFAATLMRETRLGGRLVELLRLRVAFHNQCRSCMSLRYSAGGDDPLTEGLVCSLEQPEESPDLTAAEKSALKFADLMATDHLSIADETFDDLRLHFTEPEIMEICFHVATFVGFGRMSAALDMVGDLPEEYQGSDSIAPWSVGPQTTL